MVSSEVQRTLVKSPPELWAELSDPAALARHLGELGEIRIVETKPEERVEWEAEGAAGTVSIKASGWGTKVTLSVTRELGEPKTPAETPPEAQTSEAVVEPLAATTGPKTDAPQIPDLEPESAPQPPSEPRRGLFSRLFRRRKQPIADPEPIVASEPPPEPLVSSDPELEPPIAEEPPQGESAEQTMDVSAKLKAAEAMAVGEVTAVLTAALDRLGAAHHRPFSRS